MPLPSYVYNLPTNCKRKFELMFAHEIGRNQKGPTPTKLQYPAGLNYDIYPCLA